MTVVVGSRFMIRVRLITAQKESWLMDVGGNKPLILYERMTADLIAAAMTRSRPNVIAYVVEITSDEDVLT